MPQKDSGRTAKATQCSTLKLQIISHFPLRQHNQADPLPQTRHKSPCFVKVVFLCAFYVSLCVSVLWFLCHGQKKTEHVRKRQSHNGILHIELWRPLGPRSGSIGATGTTSLSEQKDMSWERIIEGGVSEKDIFNIMSMRAGRSKTHHPLAHQES